MAQSQLSSPYSEGRQTSRDQLRVDVSEFEQMERENEFSGNESTYTPRKGTTTRSPVMGTGKKNPPFRGMGNLPIQSTRNNTDIERNGPLSRILPDCVDLVDDSMAKKALLKSNYYLFGKEFHKILTNDGKCYKELYKMIPHANGYLTIMFILVKSLISAQKTSSNNSSFFRYGPQATTSGLGARPADADIREILGHEITTRPERSRANTGKISFFISPKPRTIISANRRENKIFLSELESSYERPMGIACSPRLNFGLCSNPISNPPPFQPSFNQIKTDLVDQEVKSMLEKRS
uniref:Uncharacterized protein n=1 Tax=Magallana gigas TaxID=29159 RepID=A0A8W8IDG3_MAGGI